VALAEQTGLAHDHGILLNAFLETSVPEYLRRGRYRALARSALRRDYPRGTLGGRRTSRQTAALNMLGQRARFDSVPLFWSQRYDVPINYVGHAERWDEIVIDGEIKCARKPRIGVQL
jgi:hypothetical protein